VPREDKLRLPIQTLGRKSKCVTKLYKIDFDMPDSDFTTHQNDEFTEEVG